MKQQARAETRNYNKAIGAFMKALRVTRKLNQTEACQILGLDQSALSRVENGKQTLTAPQWAQFCDYMGLKGDLLSVVVRSPDQAARRSA